MADDKKEPDLPKPPPMPPMGKMGLPGKPPPLPPMGKGPLPAVPPPGSPLSSSPVPVPGLPSAKPPLSGTPSFMPPAGHSPLSAGEDSRVRDLEEQKKDVERRMAEMEKKLQDEKEKVLLANLRSQEEALLSSKVEASLKDIQDKLRRERREQEIEESRARLENRVKELEQKLTQERETWVHTLKGSMQQRETQDREIETHFTTRIQEMERRWLEEKAAWQKAFLNKEEEIRSLKAAVEKLKMLEGDVLKHSIERQSLEKQVSEFKSRLEEANKDRSTLESQLRTAKEREREIFEMKSQLSLSQAKEDRLLSDLERTQRELTTAAERFKEEKEKDLRRLQEEKEKELRHYQEERKEELRHFREEKEAEAKRLRLEMAQALEEKERQVSQAVQENSRFVAEMAKQKEAVSRLQAINSALERERNQARTDKTQIQQSTQGQVKEVEKLRIELARMRERYLQEASEQQAGFRVELEKSLKEEMEQQLALEKERLEMEKRAQLQSLEKEWKSRFEKEFNDKIAGQSSHASELVRVQNQLKEMLTQTEKRLAEAEKKLSTQSSSALELVQLKEQLERKLAGTEQRLGEAEKKLSDHSSSEAELQTSQNLLQQKLLEAEQRLAESVPNEELTRTKAQLEQKLAETERQYADLDRKLMEAGQRLAEAEQKLSKEEGSRQSLLKEKADLGQAFRKKEEEISPTISSLKMVDLNVPEIKSFPEPKIQEEKPKAKVDMESTLKLSEPPVYEIPDAGPISMKTPEASPAPVPGTISVGVPEILTFEESPKHEEKKEKIEGAVLEGSSLPGPSPEIEDPFKEFQPIQDKDSKKSGMFFRLFFLLCLGALGLGGILWYRQSSLPSSKEAAPTPQSSTEAESSPTTSSVPEIMDSMQQEAMDWVKGYFLNHKKKTIAEELDADKKLSWSVQKISDGFYQITAGNFLFEADMQNMSLKGLNPRTLLLLIPPPVVEEPIKPKIRTKRTRRFRKQVQRPAEIPNAELPGVDPASTFQ
ncbi:MAG: hypothetical protein HY399_00190 [Elusimicrobia bacterium]|nr:hypothetical protein [Elusimicrobiota bacterium]